MFRTITHEAPVVERRLDHNRAHRADLSLDQVHLLDAVADEGIVIPRQVQLHQGRENDLAHLELLPGFIQSLGRGLLISSTGQAVLANDDQVDYYVTSTALPAASFDTQHTIEIASEDEEHVLLILSVTPESALELLSGLMHMASRSPNVTTLSLEGSVSDVETNGYPHLILSPAELERICASAGNPRPRIMTIGFQKLHVDHHQQGVLAGFQGGLTLDRCELEDGGRAFLRADNISLRSLEIKGRNPFHELETFRIFISRVPRSLLTKLTIYDVNLSEPHYQILADEMQSLVDAQELREIDLTDSIAQSLTDEQKENCQRLLEQRFQQAGASAIDQLERQALELDRMPFVSALQTFSKLMLFHLPNVIDSSGRPVQGANHPDRAFYENVQQVFAQRLTAHRQQALSVPQEEDAHQENVSVNHSPPVAAERNENATNAEEEEEVSRQRRRKRPRTRTSTEDEAFAPPPRKRPRTRKYCAEHGINIEENE